MPPDTEADAYLARILATVEQTDPEMAAWVAARREGLSRMLRAELARESKTLLVAESPAWGTREDRSSKSASDGPWGPFIAQARKWGDQLFPGLELRDPLAYQAQVDVLTKLLAKGLKPGDDGADIVLEGFDYGTWRVADDGDHEYIAVRTLRPFMEAINNQVKGSRFVNIARKGYVVAPMDRALEVADILTRPLGGKSLAPLALAIKLALFVDTEARDCPELELLSAAKTVDDIEDPVLREQVRALVEKVPMPAPLKPRPFQAVGIAFASLANYRALIGDAMGLGKTIQAIGALSLDHKKLVPAVVVAPTSILINWQRELAQFAPWFETHIISSSKDDLPKPTKRTIYITSWGLLDRVLEDLLLAGVKTAIFDESQYAKTPHTLRSRAAKALAHGVPYVLELSGTAMENKPEELWHQLHMLDPDEFPSKEDFKRRYGGAATRVVRQKKGGEVVEREFTVEGSRALDELASRLRCYMVRRLKTDVATELPPKTRTNLWVDLPPAARRAYEKVEEELPAWIQNEYRKRLIKRAAKEYEQLYRDGLSPVEAAQLAVSRVNEDVRPATELAHLAMIRLGYLRRMLGEAKVPAAIEWIHDYFETGCNHDNSCPLIVFVDHQKPLHAIGEALTKLGLRWTYIDGSVPAAQRGQRAEDFQKGKYDVILGSQAMHAGLNLWRSSDVLFAERWWVPAREEQAEDRAHRIGQVHPVNIYYLMAPNTVDEHIADLVDQKRVLIEAVMGAEDVLTEEQSQQLEGGAVSQSLASAMVARVAGALAEGAQLRPITVRDLRRYLEGQRTP